MGQKRVGFKKSDPYDSIRRVLHRSIWWLFHRRQANFAALTSSLAGVIQGLPQSPWGHLAHFPLPTILPIEGAARRMLFSIERSILACRETGHSPVGRIDRAGGPLGGHCGSL